MIVLNNLQKLNSSFERRNKRSMPFVIKMLGFFIQNV